MGDGTVKCWGRNLEGQVGDGTAENKVRPTPVAGLAGATSIALGANSSCAITADRRVSCWGAGKAWGDGKERSRQAPGSVNGVSDAVGLDAGGLLICALLSSGRVQCWGDEDTPLSPAAKKGAPPDSGAVEISVAELHACARMGDGTVRCWGDEPWGIGAHSLSRPPVAGAKQISTGDEFACALLDRAAVSCWGRNQQGELARDPDADLHDQPVVIAGLGDVVQVVAGEAHVCALTAKGTARCWGSDGDGELGRGKQGPPELPGEVPGLVDVVEIALGADHVCARTKDGAVSCWGSNSTGQLGDGTTDRRTTPTRVVF